MLSLRRYLLVPLLALLFASAASADSVRVRVLPEEPFTFPTSRESVSAGWSLPSASYMILYGSGTCGTWQWSTQIPAAGTSAIRMMPFDPTGSSGASSSCGGFTPTVTLTDGGTGFDGTNGEAAAVPEPGTILLVGTGLVACYVRRFRR